MTTSAVRWLSLVWLVWCCVPAAFAQSIERDGNLLKVVGWAGVASLKIDDAPRIFSVRVEAQQQLPPLFGSYRIEKGALVFDPRFPLQPGLRYRAVFEPGASAPVTAIFDIPQTDRTPTTVVERVYPSTARLPENQLKFYLHFSAPMSRGEAYRRVHLLDAQGRPVALPFLELDEELWDFEGRRLTLFFDPGRIKRGLVPNNEVGAPLKEGQSYALRIDSAWEDAGGKPLKQGYQKPFTVGPADRQSPEPIRWKLVPPASGTADPLVVEFAEPMDHALLERTLRVIHEGHLVAGRTEIDRDETRWRLLPQAHWVRGEYTLEVETILADLAGNGLVRPFEVDVFDKVEQRRSTPVIRLPFRVP